MALKFNGRIDGAAGALSLDIFDDNLGTASAGYSQVKIDLPTLIAKTADAGEVLNASFQETDFAAAGQKAMVLRSQYYGTSSGGGTSSLQYIAGVNTGPTPGSGGLVESLIQIGGYVYAGGQYHDLVLTDSGGANVFALRNGLASFNLLLDARHPAWYIEDDVANNNSYFGGAISALAAAIDGGIYIGGEFKRVNGLTRNYSFYSGGLAKVQSNGQVDEAWTPAYPDGSTDAMWVSATGVLTIGGNFLHLGTTARNGMARINTDGSLDTSFVPPLSTDSTQSLYGVSSIADAGSGKIYVGGAPVMMTVAGTSGYGVARVNSDGSLDSGFGIGTGLSDLLSTYVRVGVQGDGKVLVGGAFSGCNGFANPNLVRLKTDGSVDTAFAPSINGGITALRLQSDGKILIGGTFTSINGTARIGLARLNNDGTLDTSFVANCNSGSAVQTILILTSGDIVVGGGFSTLGGQTRYCLARLHPADGSVYGF